jgi:hypothetical protein
VFFVFFVVEKSSRVALLCDLQTTTETVLPPRLVEDHRDAVGKIQTPAPGLHRYPNTLFRRQAVADLCRQTTRLGAKEQMIAGLKIGIRIACCAFRRTGEYPAFSKTPFPAFVIGVFLQGCIFVIIQPGTAHAPVIKVERDRMDQVQTAADVGTKAYDIARIRRNLRLIEYDVKH